MLNLKQEIAKDLKEKEIFCQDFNESQKLIQELIEKRN